jgi:multidrug efflux pump subunit AcrB
MRLNQIAIKQSVTVLVFLAFVLVLGLYSYFTLPREAAPEVIVPIVTVTVTYRGVSPEDMESLVTIPIERKLTGLAGVKEVTSTSLEGVSSTVIQFQAGTDIESSLQKVRDKVDLAKPDLPTEADDPVIGEVNISELPIILLCLKGDIGLAALENIAENLEDRIESIRGVLDARIVGGVEREIQIEVDPERVAQYGVPMSDLALLARLENVNTPSGALDLGEAKYLVRVPGEFKTPDELNNLVVKRGEKGVVYLRDIATIKDAFKEPTSIARVNGTPAVILTVSKRAGENIIRISDELHAVLDEARKKLPQRTDVAVIMDEATFIRSMVDELENSILSGLILVLVCIFLFMGVTNALFIALAIPISMLITFAVLFFTGITLNMIVLFSLILVLGNLVDCSIVVVENTYRHMQLGMGRLEAAYQGASEVAWPIIGSTLTTVAGFFPLIFWPGIMGDFMFYLPATVITALMASLFVGMVVNPALASLWMPKPKRMKVIEDGKVKHNAFLRAYGRVLRVALRWRLVTMAVFVTILLSIALIFMSGAQKQFMPDVEPHRGYIDIDCPQGTNLATSDTFVKEIESRVQPESQNMEFLVANVGSRGVSSFGGSGGSGGTHRSRITMKFPDLEFCKVLPTVVTERVRVLIGQIAGAELRIEKDKEGPPTGPPVNIEISGDDFAALAKLAQEVKRAVKDVPGLVGLRDDYDQGKPEVRVNVDRQRARLAGLNTQVVGLNVKAAIDGIEAGKYREKDDEYDVMVRFPKVFREDISNLQGMNLINLQGSPIPFSAVASMDEGGGLGSIKHIDRKRTVTVSGEVAEGQLAPEVLKKVQDVLKKFELPPGYTIAYTGENEHMEESQAFLQKAFVAALFLITLVMVAEFNSITQPLIIMSTVILSLTGVFMSLVMFNMPFGILMTGLAVIGLAGIVVNNGIVLMDFIRQLRQKGLPVEEAIVEGCITRFRPVMLTALTTTIGLVPMALQVSFNFKQFKWIVGGESAQYWSPMAIPFIVGLLFATLLTLFVIPILYSVEEGARSLFRRKSEGSVEVHEIIPAK